MDIDQICSTFDDESEGYITAVCSADEDLLIQIEMDSQNLSGVRVRYELRAVNVVESNVRPQWIGDIEFSDEHPLTWNYSYPWQDLYYTTAPTSRAEVIGLLYETHERLLLGWRPLTDFLNPTGVRLLGSHGLLAHGPEPLILEYVAAVQQILKVNTVRSHREPQPAKVLILGDSFAVCSNVNVTDVPIIASKS